MTLESALSRDDGRPWVPWQTPTNVYDWMVGCRERVELTAHYDRYAQRLLVTVTRYDESLQRFEPCWAQVALLDAGPFFSAKDVLKVIERWTEEVCEVVGYDPTETK